MINFHFLAPWWFLSLIPYALFFYLLFRRYRHHSQLPGQGIIPPHLAKNLRIELDSTHSMRTLWVVTILYLLVTTALAQPVWKRDPSFQLASSPLLLLLDESSSMTKNDVAPTREKRAHLLLQNLLTTAPPSREVALIAFAGSAHILLPPTDDMKVAELYLSYVDSSSMPVDGGDGAALAELIERVPAFHQPGTDILLVTDGVATGLKTLEKIIRKYKMEVVVLSLGQLGEQAAKDLGSVTLVRGDSGRINDPALAKAIGKLDAQPNSSDGHWQDETSWFAWPIALLLLFWFRRGWVLQWSFALLLSLFLQPAQPLQAAVADWFFTRDQQGMIALYRGEYKSAAELFRDPQWKGVACYYSEDWQCAQKQFAQRGDLDGLNNYAAAAAQARYFKLAAYLYSALVKIDPNYPGAVAARDKMEEFVAQIDRFTRSQKDERPPSYKAGNKSKPAQRANGSQNKVMGPVQRKLLKASDVLSSDAATEKWLRDISRDPKEFVRNKFLMEYQANGGGK